MGKERDGQCRQIELENEKKRRVLEKREKLGESEGVRE